MGIALDIEEYDSIIVENKDGKYHGLFLMGSLIRDMKYENRYEFYRVTLYCNSLFPEMCIPNVKNVHISRIILTEKFKQ